MIPTHWDFNTITRQGFAVSQAIAAERFPVGILQFDPK